MKIGIIGTGTMGRNHTRIYSQMKGIEEVYVFDLEKSAANKVADEFGVQASSSLDSLLDEANAVSICVPTKFHFETASKIIEAGKHCLVEKPVALNIEEGRKLAEMTEGKDIVVGVGHIERFNPIIHEIKKIMEDPKYLEIKRHNPASNRITDADIISDLMIHDIDIVWNFLMEGRGYKLSGASGVESTLLDLVSALVRFDNTVVSISASRLASNKIRSIIVEEENQTIVGNYMSQEVYIYRKPQRREARNANYMQENLVEKVMVSKVEPLRLELSSFFNAAKGRKDFEVTVQGATRALEIADQIRQRVNK